MNHDAAKEVMESLLYEFYGCTGPGNLASSCANWSGVILAKLAEMGVIPQWRDISSAPKDGDGDPDCDPLDLWSPSTHTYPVVGRYWAQTTDWLSDDRFEPLKPTHWRSRPTPPETGTPDYSRVSER